MGYYMGDFYAGERGDPFFGALLGIGRRVFSGVKGLLGGGGAATLARGGKFPIMRELPGAVGRVIRAHPVISGAGAAGVIGAAGAGVGRLLTPGVAPKGFHLSKKTGKVVRNRRMHVTNVKALRRSIRRMHGFARIAKHCMSFTSPRKPRGRMYFRPKRRKKC